MIVAPQHRAHQKPFGAEKALIEATTAIQSLHEEKGTQAHKRKTGGSSITCSLWVFCCYSAVTSGRDEVRSTARITELPGLQQALE
jgi:hypothetical protein